MADNNKLSPVKSRWLRPPIDCSHYFKSILTDFQKLNKSSAHQQPVKINSRIKLPKYENFISASPLYNFGIKSITFI